MNIPTPHNSAVLGSIAETVLMMADPLLVEFIAEKYLEDSVCFNKVRNILGFTGTYKGKKVSLMGSGIGMPSMGIYSYELFNFYEVKNIINIGIAHRIQPDLKTTDIIIAMGACTDSNYGSNYELPGIFAPTASYELLKKTVNVIKQKGLNFRVGNVVTVDVFYADNRDKINRWSKMGVLAWDMETAALYMNAARAGKKALSMSIIQDEGSQTKAQERREKVIDSMMKIVLEIL